MIKLTHATATIPIGMYHFPREKGPGCSLLRPDVMRRKIGVTYDVYRPITDALRTRVSTPDGGRSTSGNSPSEGRERRL